MSLLCKSSTKAAKQYVRRVAVVMAVYIVLIFGVEKFLHTHPLTGAALYVVAALPAVPVVALLAVVGFYLRDETDEFKRWQTVQAILWSIGFLMSLNTVMDFLRSFAAMPGLPPFWEFIIFWVGMAVAQSVLTLRNRVSGDD